MRRGAIAAVVALLMSAQGLAFPLCLLPCCAPVANPCHAQEQHVMQHARHHAGMHHAPVSSTRLQRSSSADCLRANVAQVASLPKVAPELVLLAPVLERCEGSAEVTDANHTDTGKERYFDPPLPNAIPLRI